MSPRWRRWSLMPLAGTPLSGPPRVHPSRRTGASLDQEGGIIPPVRGVGRLGVQVVAEAGAIPAGAGSSGGAQLAQRFERDHPRGCGEQTTNVSSTTKGLGPSPRVRGAGSGRTPAERSPGTIPAGAGSRTGAGTRRRCPGDHPRGCGEQFLAHTSAVLKEGTIPAGAGSRSRSVSQTASRWDHPRGCGEQEEAYRKVLDGSGPSPRVRGAVGQAGRFREQRGTIPAGAGSRVPMGFPRRG